MASSVGAEAYDFGSFVLRLTRASVPAGDLTIYFRNHDVGDHNLWLDPPSAVGGSPQLISEAVGEGGVATKTVAVTPGTWRLYCSLDGHAAMTRDLAVE
ncbi:MAG: Copper binding protein plastocyanin/azurin family [Solirubrobacteraceae bacterium]|nr:Copper binding protein plastocyanin/azurin family [Solirubrobacteraceae bacterium]